MELSEKIIIVIQRTNMAYQLYIDEKKYYQAKRIFKANEMLYKLLSEYLFDTTNKNLDITLTFLFHLEDWFEQFSELESQLGDKLTLDSKFIFIRKTNSPAYPSEFIDKIKN